MSFNTELTYEILGHQMCSSNPLKVRFSVTRDDWLLFAKDTPVFVVEVTGAAHVSSQEPVVSADNFDDLHGYCDIDVDCDFMQIFERSNSSSIKIVKGNILETLYAQDAEERATIHRMINEDILEMSNGYMKKALMKFAIDNGIADGVYYSEDFE